MPSMTNLETPFARHRRDARRSHVRIDLGRSGPPEPRGWTGRAGRAIRSTAFIPPLVFVVVMLAGLAVIAALSIGLGFFVTRVLEHVSGDRHT